MKKGIAVLAVAAAFGLAWASASLAEDTKCTIATKGDSPVAKACSSGGRPAAVKTMKQLVRSAKAAGTEYKCDHCHEDMDDYKLKSDAREDFKKLLAAAK
jgi:hypothetical protein